MKYLLEKISTVAACDHLLTLAQKRKQNLERKRRNLGESIDTFRNRLDQIDKDSITVQSILDAFTKAYNELPDGKDKINTTIKIKRLELRKAQLVKKAFTCNVQSLLSKQVRYNKLDSQVSAIDSYIAAVQNKRTALSHDLSVYQAAATLHAPVVHQNSLPEKMVYKQQMEETARIFWLHHPNPGTRRSRMSNARRPYSVAERFLKGSPSAISTGHTG
jgi:hypothetical protein